MRRTVPYVAAWFAAGVAAVVLASLGVSIVSQQVTGSRPAPLSADQVREELAAATDGTTSTSSIPGSTATDPRATSTTGAPGSTTPTTPTTPTTSTTSTSAAPPPAPPATTRTYDLVGGSATIRFSAQGVQVVVATPKAGFSVDIGDGDVGGVRVEFESDDHRSRLDAWWAGGPRDEVREDD